MSDDNIGRERDKDGNRLVPSEEISQIVNTRLREESEKTNRIISGLKEEIESLKQPTSAKDYTWKELETAVEKDTISKADAQTIWAKQEREKTSLEIQSAVNQAVEGVTRQTGTQQAIDQYKTAFPDIMTPGSDARNKIEAVIATKTNRFGLKEPTLAIELDALESIYGSQDKIGLSTEHARETHQDTLGGDETVQEKDKATLKGATQAQRVYYNEMILKKLMTPKEVRAQLDSKHNRHKRG